MHGDHFLFDFIDLTVNKRLIVSQHNNICNWKDQKLQDGEFYSNLSEINEIKSVYFQNYESYVDFYNFACDYETAETTRKLNLYFYPRDNSLELYDVGMRRLFLKRSVVTDISLDDIYIGNKITVYGRTIIIRDYGNSETRRLMSNMKQR